MTLVATSNELSALAALGRLPVAPAPVVVIERSKPTPLLAAARLRLLSLRVVDVVRATAAAPFDSSNQRHAAFAVLRAARLVAVGNGLATKYTDRLALLEDQLRKDILSHANGFGAAALPSLFAEYDREVNSAFDWLNGEVLDDMATLAGILRHQTRTAGAAHYNATAAPSVIGPTSTPDVLVLGAAPSDHLDKLKADLLFRLKAVTREAMTAGCTATETVERLGMKAPKITASLAIRAADPLAAIGIGIRLFDATDNSFWKFVQATVTALAQAADAESDFGDEEVNMGWVWVSAADANVCEFCEAMDGQKWDADKEPIDDAPELDREPPAHFNCRCSLLPCDLDEEPPKGGFKSYLAHFSDEEQKQAFGEKAVAAYRRGELTPAQLMAQDEHTIPLEKFREMEPRLELDEEKYSKMGEATGAAANAQTLERRIRSVLFKVSAATAFDPAQHPRVPAGSPGGGEFVEGEAMSAETAALKAKPVLNANEAKEELGAYMKKRMRWAGYKMLDARHTVDEAGKTIRLYRFQKADGSIVEMKAADLKAAADADRSEGLRRLAAKADAKKAAQAPVVASSNGKENPVAKALNTPGSSVTRKKIGGGHVSVAEKMTITTPDGEEFSGVYKPVSGDYHGRQQLDVRGVSCCDRELACADIAERAGIKIPAVHELNIKNDGGRGSFQEWIDGTTNTEFPHGQEVRGAELAMFDGAVGNTDRHGGNYIVMHDHKTVMPIDNGLTFPDKTPSPTGRCGGNSSRFMRYAKKNQTAASVERAHELARKMQSPAFKADTHRFLEQQGFSTRAKENYDERIKYMTKLVLKAQTPDEMKYAFLRCAGKFWGS